MIEGAEPAVSGARESNHGRGARECGETARPRLAGRRQTRRNPVELAI